MLELLDEGDPQQSITASSRSAKRSRIVNNPAKSRAASSLQRQLHCAVSNSVGAPIGVGEVMPSGKTTSNVGSSLLVDRTDSSNPSQLSNDAVQQEEPTDFQEVQHSDAPPPSYAPATSLIGSITHLPATSQQQNVLPQRRGVRTFLEHSFEEVAEVETAQHLAKRQRCLRIGPPPPLLPEQLWVEDRESPAERDDDEDGHYQFEVGENFTRRFKIMRKFGEGTFGRVVECWDRLRRDYVAVKIIRNIQKYRDAAMVELEILRVLEREDPTQTQGHCVRLLEWFDYRGHVCMVFERLGLSLYDFMRRNVYRPFPLDMARSFIQQLLESVAFMHGLGLVHTDLKPENILLRSQASIRVPQPPGSKLCKRYPDSTEVCVIDFGSAAWETEYHSAVVCTRHYRAPEVILGLGWSYPADLWSIGCILVELVTGDALFQTHENLEHLAMMEVVLGAIPQYLAAQADAGAAGYFQNNRLDWPSGASSKKSVKAVAKLRRLRDYLRQHSDATLHEYIDLLMDLLKRLLEYDPSLRCTAVEALQHPFFAVAICPQPVPQPSLQQQQAQ